jgi:hypothetical protein
VFVINLGEPSLPGWAGNQVIEDVLSVNLTCLPARSLNCPLIIIKLPVSLAKGEQELIFISFFGFQITVASSP